MAGLVLAASMFQVPYALETLLTIMAIFSLIYYNLCFKLLTGLAVSHVMSEKEDVKSALLSNLTHIAGFVTLFQSGYQLYSMILAPWIVMSTVTMVFAFLLYIEYVEIKESDEDDS